MVEVVEVVEVEIVMRGGYNLKSRLLSGTSPRGSIIGVRD